MGSPLCNHIRNASIEVSVANWQDVRVGERPKYLCFVPRISCRKVLNKFENHNLALMCVEDFVNFAAASARRKLCEDTIPTSNERIRHDLTLRSENASRGIGRSDAAVVASNCQADSCQ
jgi:hypothetical protein